MKAEGDTAKLAKLIGSPEASSAPTLPETHSHGDPVTAVLIESFLAWRTGEEAARHAFERLLAETVDFNEARVLLVEELVEVFGKTSPHAEERAVRLRRALNDVYEREHSVSMSFLLRQGKREARGYLETLDGMPPFVAARVTLLALGGHAFPIDERHVAALADAGVLSQEDESGAVSAWMERQFRAGEAFAAYQSLETACAAAPAPKKKRQSSRRPASGKKTKTNGKKARGS
ncbi:MAG: hypothetical protein AAGG07_03225 [Planctomycetota bacterium]